MVPRPEDLGVELVEADVHDLHADPDVSLPEHGPVEVDGVGAVRGPHRHVQVHQQALRLKAVHRGSYPLKYLAFFNAIGNKESKLF